MATPVEASGWSIMEVNIECTMPIRKYKKIPRNELSQVDFCRTGRSEVPSLNLLRLSFNHKKMLRHAQHDRVLEFDIFFH
ncbi:MAG: hypothetical protein V3S64_06475, partial [bacterium]